MRPQDGSSGKSHVQPAAIAAATIQGGRLCEPCQRPREKQDECSRKGEIQPTFREIGQRLGEGSAEHSRNDPNHDQAASTTDEVPVAGGFSLVAGRMHQHPIFI